MFGQACSVKHVRSSMFVQACSFKHVRSTTTCANTLRLHWRPGRQFCAVPGRVGDDLESPGRVDELVAFGPRDLLLARCSWRVVSARAAGAEAGGGCWQPGARVTGSTRVPARCPAWARCVARGACLLRPKKRRRAGRHVRAARLLVAPRISTASERCKLSQVHEKDPRIGLPARYTRYTGHDVGGEDEETVAAAASGDAAAGDGGDGGDGGGSSVRRCCSW